jgi:NitT/TauT family transport system substrate-binding protein
VRTPADLRGRRFALNSKGSSAEYLAEPLLRQGNLQPSDVEYVEMSFGDMGAAFAGRTIDVAVGGEPTATSAVNHGLATKWLCGADVVPNLQFTYLLYSSQFADQRTDVAQRWMTAYLRGAREWQTMLETGQDKDAMLSVLGKYTPVKDLALLERATLPVPAAEARIDVANITNQLTWMHQRGYISHEPSLDRFVDTRFVQWATQDGTRR